MSFRGRTRPLGRRYVWHGRVNRTMMFWIDAGGIACGPVMLAAPTWLPSLLQHLLLTSMHALHVNRLKRFLISLHHDVLPFSECRWSFWVQPQSSPSLGTVRAFAYGVFA